MPILKVPPGDTPRILPLERALTDSASVTLECALRLLDLGTGITGLCVLVERDVQVRWEELEGRWCEIEQIA